MAGNTLWYAAHIILYALLKEEEQDEYFVWEDIVLIAADSLDVAFQKAEQHGLHSSGDCNGTFRYEGKPATIVLAGVRKIVECVDPRTRPADGTEVTYSDLVVKSKEDIEKLARGEEVNVLYTQVEPALQGKGSKKRKKIATKRTENKVKKKRKGGEHS
jgi:hypothetical protein